MTNKQYELAQHCIDTEEFVTIKTSERYILFHRNAVKYLDHQQFNFEIPSAIIRRISGVNPLCIKDAKIVPHVDSSFYDLIIFADKSLVYTRKRRLSDEEEDMKILPYYVNEDLELLKNIGISKEEIELFVKKLDGNDDFDLFNSNKYDRVIQRIISFTDIPTRLRCREVSHRWKKFVDNSSSWHYIKLPKHCQYIDRALNYFQNIDIRELDLSESSFESSTVELHHEFYVYSLRSLYISTDHPLELFTLLFKVAPFLQHIKLKQSYDSSIKLHDNNQLYECIHFVISQCEQRLKCLRRLHIQLRSVSDQIFLKSSSVTSIPILYEIIN